MKIKKPNKYWCNKKVKKIRINIKNNFICQVYKNNKMRMNLLQKKLKKLEEVKWAY